MPEDDNAASPPADYASWLPHDLAYNAAFEDSIADLLLDGAAARKASGIRVIPRSSSEVPVANVSVHEAMIDATALPRLGEEDLPLPVADARRLYASPVPGLLLTHPGGFLQGGPGLDPEEDEFAGHFVGEHSVRNGRELARVKAREVERWMGVARERAKARRAAAEKRVRIEAEIRALGEQVEMETKVLVKARERARERRERKERRRKG